MRLAAPLEHALRLRERLGNGEIDEAAYCAEMRAADVEDALAEEFEGERLASLGKIAEAEKHFWRAADLAPWSPMPFFYLATLLADRGQAGSPAELLLLQAFHLIRLADQEEPWEDRTFDPISRQRLRSMLNHLGLQMDIGGLDAPGRAALAGELLLDAGTSSGDPVDPRVLLHLLLTTLFLEEMDREDVDRLLAVKEQAAPLLGAIPDGFAAGLLGRSAMTVAERAAALLGEMGEVRFLGSVLSAASAWDDGAPEAALWAIRRWIEGDPAGFGEQLRRLAPRIETSDVEWLVMALSKARRGERLAPAWEAVYEAGCATGALAGPAGAGLAMSARILFGKSAPERAERVRHHFEKFWNRRDRDLAESLLEPNEDAVKALRRHMRKDLPDVYEICNYRKERELENPEEEDVEASTAEAAEARLRRTGRNDPCWCGSGKKYKKCHLEQDQAAAHRGKSGQQAAPIGGPFAEVRRGLVKLAERSVSGASRRTALEEFFGSRKNVDEDDLLAFMDWLIFDWEPLRGGKRLIEQYLESEGPRLPSPVR
ncbi:MAG: SEC-C domain-containing protein [Bryobacteraceae bacterium]